MDFAFLFQFSAEKSKIFVHFTHLKRHTDLNVGVISFFFGLECIKDFPENMNKKVVDISNEFVFIKNNLFLPE